MKEQKSRQTPLLLAPNLTPEVIELLGWEGRNPKQLTINGLSELMSDEFTVEIRFVEHTELKIS